MKLLRFLLIVLVVAIAGRLAVRSVSVESTGRQVQITVDKQKLKETGRAAAGRIGAALQRAGRRLEGEQNPDARE